MSLENALAAWRNLLGPEFVIADEQARANFIIDTSCFRQPVSAILTPQSRTVIPELVRIAHLERVPLYPVSTGRNWGYGTANPPVPNCVVLRLESLREILIDEELGSATLEPGVTQRQLHEYCIDQRLPFMIPVTGAGPDCSLVGNALERGFGLAPYADHFSAVTSIEAVLPTGEIYRSPLAQLGAEAIDRVFKWGIGPYVDGLFAQGSFGVVTRATISLARLPERTAVFFISIPDDAKLETAVTMVRDIMRACGANLSSVNLMNASRMRIMASAYGDAISASNIVAAERLAAWTAAGAIYGTSRVVSAVRQEVQRYCHRAGLVSRFVDPTKVKRYVTWLKRLPSPVLAKTRLRLEKLLPSLAALVGEPTEVALPLAYAATGRKPVPGKMNPAQDGCGLYWYSPLIPMQPQCARALVSMVTEIMNQHGLAAPITLTAISERCIESTVPLLFSPSDHRAALSAEACYRSLFDAGRRLGFVPYRLGSQHMQYAIDPDLEFWQLVHALKAAVDPNGVIAPGRYAPLR